MPFILLRQYDMPCDWECSLAFLEEEHPAKIETVCEAIFVKFDWEWDVWLTWFDKERKNEIVFNKVMDKSVIKSF